MIEPGTETGEVSAATEDELSVVEAEASGREDVTTGVGPVPVRAETVRLLEAEINVLREELDRRDAALAALAERLIPVETAREEGRAEERRRRSDAEEELHKLQATRLYRLLLRPRAALFRFRERRGTVE